MAFSTITDTPSRYGIHFVSADGGTRKQRGSAIAAYARKHNLRRITGKPTYSETFGFQTRTTIRFQEV